MTIEKKVKERPYINSRGETPPPGSKSTGWVHADAVIQVGCSRCGSTSGFHCKTPSGKKAWPPHTERIIEMNKAKT